MSDYLPFQDTTVNADTSIGNIMSLLAEAKFTKTMHYREGDRVVIAAERDGAMFQFEAHVDRVLARLKSYRSRYRANSREALERKARNIAWRIVYNQIKNACDIIRYDVGDVAEVFGGYLQMNHPKRGRLSLAEFIISEAAEGRIDRPMLPSPINGLDFCKHVEEK